MRANITTAPVFPGDAADGAAVVGMMVGGAGPLGGIPREEHPPGTSGTSASHPRLPECPSPISRSRVAALTRLCRGKLPERGFPSPHIQFT
jgi:hypothetical protein